MYAKSQRRCQGLKNKTETMILKNADVTLLGCVRKLTEERDEITMKLKDSEVEVKALQLLDEVWSYKFIAVIAFLVALLLGIILRHFSPTLSLHLLLLTFNLTPPLLGWHWATQIN